jgi:DNA repair exonuclease SbcCD ATPase subunit
MIKYNIVFDKIRFKNFMGYGNSYTEFNFNEGLTVISGQNGHGKSAIMMALFYGLYGKPFKKNKLGSLINDINLKDMKVEVYFSANNNEYKIIRGQKPNIFEIYENDKLINQSATVSEYQDYLETYIIKINENIFRQLICLGAGVAGSKSFIDLTKSEKEELFQIITDTSIFKVIKDSIKERTNALKTKSTEAEYKLKVLASSIQVEKNNIAQMELQNSQVQATSTGRLDEINSRIKDINDKKEKIKNYLVSIKNEKLVYDEKLEEYNNLILINNTLNQKLQASQNEISKINTVKNAFGVCLGCDKLKSISKVDLSAENDLLNTIEKYKLEIENNINTINPLEEFIEEFKQKISKAKLAKEQSDSYSLEEDRLNKEKESMRNQQKIEIDYSGLKDKEVELDSIKADFTTYSSELSNLKILDGLLSNENLKGVIINQTLPILNKYINEYMRKFSDFDFNFYIDSNFKENVIFKSRDREYYSLSNGQGFRIMFSILFAFLKIVEERNGVSTNILILDEMTDQSIDSIGREELLNTLKTDFAIDKNVIIISHNPEVLNNEIFDTRYMVSQVNSFSKISTI